MPGIVVTPAPAQVVVFKALTADVGPISAQTVLQNLGALNFTIGASATETWFFEAYLLVSAANATMDVQFGLTVPASATAKHGAVAGLGSEAPGFGDRSAPNARSLMNSESAATQVATAIGTTGSALAGMVFGGGTAGTVQLQYAQITSDAGNLSILKGSFMRATQIRA